MKRWPKLCAALTLACLPSSAIAKDWVFKTGSVEERTLRRVRYNARASLWVANYDRPSRACVPSAPGFPSLFCPSDNSDEVGMGLGFEVQFRTWGPIYVTTGMDFVFSDPSSQALKKQFIIAAPFGVLVTWYDWVVRPILHATITPVLLITDDLRDFTLGGNGGIAVRLGNFGSLSLTAGYQWSEPVKPVQIQLAVHPL